MSKGSYWPGQICIKVGHVWLLWPTAAFLGELKH